jgi:hypothetical protein
MRRVGGLSVERVFRASLFVRFEAAVVCDLMCGATPADHLEVFCGTSTAAEAITTI